MLSLRRTITQEEWKMVRYIRTRSGLWLSRRENARLIFFTGDLNYGMPYPMNSTITLVYISDDIIMLAA